MKVYFLIGLVLVLINSQALSKSKKKAKTKFIKVELTTKKKDSLAKMISRFAKPDVIINKKTKMVKLTIKKNPKIKKWRKMKPGQKVRLYLDPKLVDLKKVAKYKKKFQKKKKKKQKSKPKNWSMFYMASSGAFTQEDASIGDIDFNQNSPVTLGAMYIYRPKNKNFSISNSLYFSYLLATSSNLSEEDKEVPLEIGFNSYYQKNVSFFRAKHQLYAGFDFERFNTFNLEGVKAENDLIFDQNLLGFLTLGYAKNIKITKKFNLLFKTSISSSIFSSRSTGYSDETNTETYSGTKYMFFLSSNVYKDYFISFLAKFHTLSGPSDVNSTRLGFGLGKAF